MEFSVTWALVSAGAWIKTAMNAGARWYEDYLTAQVCLLSHCIEFLSFFFLVK